MLGNKGKGGAYRSGGTRGGQALFSWEDVKKDKDRSHYLGNSQMAAVGRWQTGKDILWYTKDSKSNEDLENELAEERQRLKEEEEDRINAQLGLPPTKRVRKDPNASHGSASKESASKESQKASSGKKSEAEELKALFGVPSKGLGFGKVKEEPVSGSDDSDSDSHSSSSSEDNADRKKRKGEKKEKKREKKRLKKEKKKAKKEKKREKKEKKEKEEKEEKEK